MAPTKQITPRAQEYLDGLRSWGRGVSSKKVRDYLGIHGSQVSRWRAETKGFRAAEAAAMKEANKATHTTDTTMSVAVEDLSLDGIEEAWINAYEETYDRIEACNAVGIKWFKIRKMLNERPAFMRRFRGVFEELVIRNEDMLAVKGASGDTPSARTFLKAHRPETYGSKVTVNTNHTHYLDATSVEATKNAWLKQFGGVDKKQLTNGSVIEGEIIE